MLGLSDSVRAPVLYDVNHATNRYFSYACDTSGLVSLSLQKVMVLHTLTSLPLKMAPLYLSHFSSSLS